jgi:hypothetical protein
MLDEDAKRAFTSSSSAWTTTGWESRDLTEREAWRHPYTEVIKLRHDTPGGGSGVTALAGPGVDLAGLVGRRCRVLASRTRRSGA